MRLRAGAVLAHQHSPTDGSTTVVLLRSMEAVREGALQILRRPFRR